VRLRDLEADVSSGGDSRNAGNQISLWRLKMKKPVILFWVFVVILIMVSSFLSVRFLAGWWVGQLVALVPVSDFVFWSKLDAGFMLAFAFLIGFSPFVIWFFVSTALSVGRAFED
jgi:hypothetical protein